MTVTLRRAMTPARKRRIHKAWEGRCCLCGEPVEETGPGVIYEHILVLWITKSDEDEEIGPAHKACAGRKTKADLKTIAKIKRLIRNNSGEARKSKRPIKNRGFDKTIGKRMNGQVYRREK